MVADWEFLNAQWTDGMCAKLQIVQIINVATHRWFPISFMKLILSKASLLRTLSVNECPGSQDDPLNDLLTCRRASVQAEVLFKVKKKLYFGLQTYLICFGSQRLCPFMHYSPSFCFLHP